MFVAPYLLQVVNSTGTPITSFSSTAVFIGPWTQPGIWRLSENLLPKVFSVRDPFPSSCSWERLDISKVDSVCWQLCGGRLWGRGEGYFTEQIKVWWMRTGGQAKAISTLRLVGELLRTVMSWWVTEEVVGQKGPGGTQSQGGPWLQRAIVSGLTFHQGLQIQSFDMISQGGYTSSQMQQ